MTLTAIYANLRCTDLGRSEAWFTALFGRAPDARPMNDLLEWHHGKGAGLQLFAGEGGANAGAGTLTLIVAGIAEEHRRLGEAGIAGDAAVEPGDMVSILRLRDPDGNLVVLAQPGRP